MIKCLQKELVKVILQNISKFSPQKQIYNFMMNFEKVKIGLQELCLIVKENFANI